MFAAAESQVSGDCLMNGTASTPCVVCAKDTTGNNSSEMKNSVGAVRVGRRIERSRQALVQQGCRSGLRSSVGMLSKGHTSGAAAGKRGSREAGKRGSGEAGKQDFAPRLPGSPTPQLLR